MKRTRFEHYKNCCKKYGVIKWHILIALAPVFVVLLIFAKFLQWIGEAGCWIENTINRI